MSDDTKLAGAMSRILSGTGLAPDASHFEPREPGTGIRLSGTPAGVAPTQKGPTMLTPPPGQWSVGFWDGADRFAIILATGLSLGFDPDPTPASDVRAGRVQVRVGCKVDHAYQLSLDVAIQTLAGAGAPSSSTLAAASPDADLPPIDPDLWALAQDAAALAARAVDALSPAPGSPGGPPEPLEAALARQRSGFRVLPAGDFVLWAADRGLTDPKPLDPRWFPGSDWALHYEEVYAIRYPDHVRVGILPGAGSVSPPTGPEHHPTTRAMLRVLRELGTDGPERETALNTVYNIDPADDLSPLDVAVWAWVKAGCPGVPQD